MVVRAPAMKEADDRPLAGRVALVTGVNGGLGRAIREQLVAHGGTVFGVDFSGDDCFHADIRTPSGNCDAVAAVIELHGRLDILILNAGVQHMAPLPEFPDAEWDRLVSTMLTGPFLAIKHAWRYLTSEPGGRIIATASTSSLVGEQFKAAYVAAKHGLLGLVKVGALEGAEYGLTVNAVAPSWMYTTLVQEQIADRARLLGLSEQTALEGVVAEQRAKRFVETQEVAAVIAFLASPAASGLTGACIPVDLGALA